MKPQNDRLVTVLTTGDAGTIAVAASILESAEIPYFEKGGASRGLGIQLFNASAGFVEFQVRPEDATAAHDLLSHLE
jgi:hypothetical protein